MRLAAAALGATALCLAALARAGEPTIPEQYTAAVQRANQLGASLYAHDHAASVASDELVERHAVPADRRVRGWLTRAFEAGEAAGIVVTFVGEQKGKALSLYRVRVPGDGGPLEYEALAPGVALDDSETAGWAARSAAARLLAKRRGRCGERYNPVVLPAIAGGDGVIRVYMLASTNKPALMIAGGHVLYEYSADGRELLSERGFTRACIDLPLSHDLEKGEIAGLMLSHLLDPTPTEIHVFLSRNYRQNLFPVTTQNSLMWEIREGTIVGATDFGKN